MPGQIKKGKGTLIGNAGEFFVAAELLKRGTIAALAPRNAHSFDILATNGLKTAKIRVKTKSAEYTDWQWMVKKDGKIFHNLSSNDDFTVLVNLTMETKDMEYYILPTGILNEWLVNDFEEWVHTLGKNDRPHDPTNKKRHLSYPKFAKQLEEYRNAWGKIL